MRIAVFGLGYVGCVSAACFARDGHVVVGVDTVESKVEAINEGVSPVVEPGLPGLIADAVTQGRLSATTAAAVAVEQADLLMICVGTPSLSTGGLDLRFVERVCSQVGEALTSRRDRVVVAIRSTVLPGTFERVIRPTLERASGKVIGEHFGLCINPEFLREGSAIADFDDPPFTVVGQFDDRSGDVLQSVYGGLNAPIFRVGLGEAEMIKYASNAFHALKVVFANEIGRVCEAHDIDSHGVMSIFVEDRKLNLSPCYLKPGFAFGGSCLPKDVRALLHTARQAHVPVPTLSAILPSNQQQIDRAVQMVLGEQTRRVAILGMSFKPNTDDVRESPAVELIERLIGKGVQPRIYDAEVALSRLHGANADYLNATVPHIVSLIEQDLDSAVTDTDVVVVTKPLTSEQSERLVGLLTDEQLLIDLVRLDREVVDQLKAKYRGIGW